MPYRSNADEDTVCDIAIETANKDSLVSGWIAVGTSV